MFSTKFFQHLFLSTLTFTLFSATPAFSQASDQEAITGTALVTITDENGQVIEIPALPVGKSKFSGKSVVIDPGHGGSDAGSIRSGVRERDITLSVSNTLRNELEKLGAVVTMTRTTDTDVSLADRSNLSNTVKPDIFVSIHCNVTAQCCDDTSAHGIETYYYTAQSKGLAQYTHAEVILITEALDRHVRSNRGFYVIKHTQAPSILMETGFISNKTERDNLNDPKYQAKIAQGIVNGLEKLWLPQTRTAPKPSQPKAESAKKPGSTKSPKKKTTNSGKVKKPGSTGNHKKPTRKQPPRPSRKRKPGNKK